LAPAPPGASLRAAIGRAAHDTLVALYPSQSTLMDTDMNDELAQIPDGAAKDLGVTVGQAAAQAILQLRTGDGSQIPEPHIGIDYFPSNMPGQWRPDPISQVPIALGANWSQVTPFAMQSADQFRVPPPPAITSSEYALAYDEARVFGGDGTVTPTLRTPEQTLV